MTQSEFDPIPRDDHALPCPALLRPPLFITVSTSIMKPVVMTMARPAGTHVGSTVKVERRGRSAQQLLSPVLASERLHHVGLDGFRPRTQNNRAANTYGTCQGAEPPPENQPWPTQLCPLGGKGEGLTA